MALEKQTKRVVGSGSCRRRYSPHKAPSPVLRRRTASLSCASIGHVDSEGVRRGEWQSSSGLERLGVRKCERRWLSLDLRQGAGFGEARAYGRSMVHGRAWVLDHARVLGCAGVSGFALVHDSARALGWARVRGVMHVAGMTKSDLKSPDPAIDSLLHRGHEGALTSSSS